MLIVTRNQLHVCNKFFHYLVVPRVYYPIELASRHPRLRHRGFCDPEGGRRSALICGISTLKFCRALVTCHVISRSPAFLRPLSGAAISLDSYRGCRYVSHDTPLNPRQLSGIPAGQMYGDFRQRKYQEMFRYEFVRPCRVSQIG